jgi:hypothetical protein
MGTRPAWLAAIFRFSGMGRRLGPAALAGLTFAAVPTAGHASTAPSREDEATDDLYGGQVSPTQDTTPKAEPKPKSEPKEAPAAKEPPEPTDEPQASTDASAPDPAAPTSSKAPGSDVRIAADDRDDDASDEPVTPSEGSDAPSPDADETRRENTGRSLSHHRKGSLSVMPGWGFSAIVPYQKRIFCGEFSDDPGSSTKRKSFCTMGSPWFIEFTGGYGVHPRLDVVLGVRLNVQKRDYRCRGDEIDSCKGLFNDSLAVGLAPGIRAWISDPERMFKIGGAVDFIWLHESFSGYRRRDRCEGRDDVVNGPCPVEEPVEGYDGSRADERRISDDDIGFRIGPVLQVDPHPNVGIFLMPAARMGLLRWFEFSFDIALGVQARFP